MTPLEKELVEALERVLPFVGFIPFDAQPMFEAKHDADALLTRAKQTGTHEFAVTDDGHGRAMVGGRRLAWCGAGMLLGDAKTLPGAPLVTVGTRVRVELRDGVDYATLVEVL